MAFAGLAGCQSHLHPELEPAPAQNVTAVCADLSWRETKLFLGMGDGIETPIVTDFELMEFIDEFVTPKFAKGYTVLRGTGAWMDQTAQTTTTEASAILLIMHPPEPEITEQIAHIGELYIERFNQQASLLAWTDECTRFIFAED